MKLLGIGLLVLTFLGIAGAAILYIFFEIILPAWLD